MAVDLYFESKQDIFPKIWIPALNKALEKAGLKGKDATVSFVGKKTISELNEKHRGCKGATDVISFELGGGKGAVGEVVVCPEEIRKNAEEYKVTYTEELLRSIVHGLLHIGGHKHADKLTPQPASSRSGKTADPGARSKSGSMFSIQEAIVKDLFWDVFYPRVVVGLGNPGSEYEDSRHNVGFMFIDNLSEKLTNADIKLLKPQSGMNRSGKHIRDAVRAEKVDPRESLLVVHDELDIVLGGHKLSYGSGGLHRGVKDIEQSLKTKKFWRLRIGVDNRPAGNRTPGREYVLEDFSTQERAKIDIVIEEEVNSLVRKIQ